MKCKICGRETINNMTIGPHCPRCWELHVLEIETGKFDGITGNIKVAAAVGADRVEADRSQRSGFETS